MTSLLKEIKFEQPKSFKFTKENLNKVDSIIARYPKKRSAIMPLLHLVQKQESDSWISTASMDYIAELLNIPSMYVYEAANFYTMFNKQPVGKYLIQICRTTPCWLRGSDDIKSACKKKLGIDVGETTKDNKFTLVEVECLGSCANAPIVQINNDYYEDLSPESITKILDALKSGKKPKIGSQIDRKGAEPKIKKE